MLTTSGWCEGDDDGSSSEDNLFNESEWQYTKQVFGDHDDVKDRFSASAPASKHAPVLSSSTVTFQDAYTLSPRHQYANLPSLHNNNHNNRVDNAPHIGNFKRHSYSHHPHVALRAFQRRQPLLPHRHSVMLTKSIARKPAPIHELQKNTNRHPFAEPDSDGNGDDEDAKECNTISEHDEIDDIDNMAMAMHMPSEPVTAPKACDDHDIVSFVNHLHHEQQAQQMADPEHARKQSVISDYTDKYDALHSYESQCASIQQCEPLKRMITCLDFYGNIIGESIGGTGLIQEYFNNYPHFLDDYYHILSVHINTGDAVSDAENFEIVYEKIGKYITCALSTCSAYTRMHRNRDDDDDDGILSSEYIPMNAAFYVEMMDSIHCRLIHSYECGYRQRRRSGGDVDDGGVGVGVDAASLFDDRELKQLRRRLVKQRAEIACIKGEDFLSMNKFNNCLTPVKKTQQHGVGMVNNGSLTSDDDDNRFGTKCYFWDWYKHNDDADPFNGGYRYRDFYIPCKYKHFKEEMLCNTHGHQLNATQYNRSYNKALVLVNTVYVRTVVRTENNFANFNTKKCIYNNFALSLDPHYDIQPNDPISVEHILALIFYTDYTKLSFYFRNSFHHLQFDSFVESDHEFKLRKQEYWYWSKLLTECVEIYGEWMSASKYTRFYTGVCEPHLFPHFELNMIAPLSATPDLSIAALHCDVRKGYVLELTPSSAPVSLFCKFFQCSFLSSFGYENECIFLGGCSNGKSMRIQSIRCLRTGQNYACFITAINVFLRMLCAKGKETAEKHLGAKLDEFDDVDSTPRKQDLMILDKLIAHRLATHGARRKQEHKFPAYVYDMFRAVVMSRKCLKLNMDEIKKCPKLMKYVIVGDEQPKNVGHHYNGIDFVAFLSLLRLCPNCVHIVVEMSFARNMINKREISVLQQIMIRVNAFPQLQCITLLNIGNQSNQKWIKQFRHVLNKIDWDITIQPQLDPSKYHKFKLYQYRIFRKRKRNFVAKFLTFMSK